MVFDDVVVGKRCICIEGVSWVEEHRARVIRGFAVRIVM